MVQDGAATTPFWRATRSTSAMPSALVLASQKKCLPFVTAAWAKLMCMSGGVEMIRASGLSDIPSSKAEQVVMP